MEKTTQYKYKSHEGHGHMSVVRVSGHNFVNKLHQQNEFILSDKLTKYTRNLVKFIENK